MQGIRLVDVTGAIITIAARGTQTALATEVVVGGADDVLALKETQEKRHDAVVTYVAEQMQTDFSDSGAHRLVTPEHSHGRVEQRIVIPMPAPPSLPGFGRGTGLKTIAVVLRMSPRDGKETYQPVENLVSGGTSSLRAPAHHQKVAVFLGGPARRSAAGPTLHPFFNRLLRLAVFHQPPREGE